MLVHIFGVAWNSQWKKQVFHPGPRSPSHSLRTGSQFGEGASGDSRRWGVWEATGEYELTISRSHPDSSGFRGYRRSRGLQIVSLLAARSFTSAYVIYLLVNNLRLETKHNQNEMNEY